MNSQNHLEELIYKITRLQNYEIKNLECPMSL